MLLNTKQYSYYMSALSIKLCAVLSCVQYYNSVIHSLGGTLSVACIACIAYSKKQSSSASDESVDSMTPV